MVEPHILEKCGDFLCGCAPICTVLYHYSPKYTVLMAKTKKNSKRNRRNRRKKVQDSKDWRNRADIESKKYSNLYVSNKMILQSIRNYMSKHAGSIGRIE